MTAYKKSPRQFSFEQLDTELVARGARGSAEERVPFKDTMSTPLGETMIEKVKAIYCLEHAPALNETLSHLSIWDISKALMIKIREMQERAVRNGLDTRKDFYMITSPQVKKNTGAVVSLWMNHCLMDNRDGTANLKLAGYKEKFNLCKSEPFIDQLIADGLFCSGFLVKEDVIATAAHFAHERNVKDLRIVFGFNMADVDSQVTRVPEEDVYCGMEILHRVYDPKKSRADWALIKLDRPVKNRQPLRLSKRDIRKGDHVYVLGHPCGLPLKYVPGAPVTETEPTYFSANLTVYGGNSGSPVFNNLTHELVGMVVRGDVQDFRWTGRGWLSLSFPNPGITSMAPQCTAVSCFRQYCN